jgi:pyruvate-formate lyase-activating enzyme
MKSPQVDGVIEFRFVEIIIRAATNGSLNSVMLGVWSMAEGDLLDRLVLANPAGVISRRAGFVEIEGVAQSWAYAASVALDISGEVTLVARIRLRSGTMSVGVLAKDGNSFVVERPIPRTDDFIDISILLHEVASCGEVVFRTYDRADDIPVLEVESLALQRPAVQNCEPAKNLSDPPIDPIVENLWPLETTTFNLPAMRRWSLTELRKYFTGDAWRDNLILNKYEFANGESHLKSYPWRFSVPFVLCNARCEFCSAWLVQGQPMPVDLLDRLDVVLPYLAQIDMVGWGEPLIHPRFGDILSKLRDRADPRARISLTTNGVHLKKWALRLIESNVKEHAVSIHAATPETHEDLMGLPRGSFAAVLEGIRFLTALKSAHAGITIGLVFIVTRQNLAEIPAFISLAHELKVDSIFIRTLKARTLEEHRLDGLDYHRLPPYLHPNFKNLRREACSAIFSSSIPVQATPETWSTTIFPKEIEAAILAEPLTPREVWRASKTSRRTPPPDTDVLPVGLPLTAEDGDKDNLSDIQTHLADDLLENPYNRSPPLFCPSPYTALYINGFDRNVTPCCYMAQVPGYQLSYLRKSASFDDVWNSPAMIGLRRSLNAGPLKAPCKKCAFYW